MKINWKRKELKLKILDKKCLVFLEEIVMAVVGRIVEADMEEMDQTTAMEDMDQLNLKKIQTIKMIHITMAMQLVISEIITTTSPHWINTKILKTISLQETTLIIRKSRKNQILLWKLKSLLKR